MSAKPQEVVLLYGKPYRKQVILADANVPYKLTLDRIKNKLFFCINADEFSNQSFHSVVLDLDTGVGSVIPGIRNGFASAVDPLEGTVYLGGSDGIFKYNYQTLDVDKSPLIKGVDVFDMFFKNEIFFVDTATQNLCTVKNGRKFPVKALKEFLIQHFVIDNNNDTYFINSMGLFVLPHGSKNATAYPDGNLNFRGAAVDASGVPYFIAEDGIFAIDQQSKSLQKVLSVKNGYGLAFDKDNNIVYSDDRSLTKLIPLKY